MVPRAANRIPDNQTLVQRTVVMGAGSADGEYLLAPSYQQDRLGPDMAEHHCTVRKLGEIEAAGQIGAARRGCSFGHGSVLPILNITSYFAAACSPVSSCERESGVSDDWHFRRKAPASRLCGALIRINIRRSNPAARKCPPSSLESEQVSRLQADRPHPQKPEFYPHDLEIAEIIDEIAHGSLSRLVVNASPRIIFSTR